MSEAFPPPGQDPAARRFAVIQAVRLAGIAALLAGMAMLAGALAAPAALGVVLVIAGALGTFLVPTLLARRWSSRRGK